MKNINKILVMLSLAALMLALICGVAMADGDCTESPDGKHDFRVDPSSVQAATCTQPTSFIERCIYCNTERRGTTGNPAGHMFGEWQTTKEATCTAPGTETRTCQRSGCDEKQEKEIPQKSHNYVPHPEQTIPATCTEASKIPEICSECQDTQYRPMGSPLGHDFEHGTPVKADPGTCTTPGSTAGTKCSRCDATQGVTSTGLNTERSGHSYTSQTTPGDCGKEAVTTYTCSRCEVGTANHSYQETGAKDLTNHGDYGTEPDEESAKAATCTTAGKEANLVCKNCKEVITYGDETDPLGHEWGEWEIIEEATTKKEGLERRYCTRGELCDGAGEDDETEYDEELGIAYQERTIAKKTVSKPSTGSSSSSSAAPAATAEPAPEYGSIVTDVARADELYEAEIVEEPIEETEDPEDINHVLIITAKPDEDGKYVLRNLHITDELLAKLAEKHIEIVRFVVGDATVEFPVASFTGETMEAVKADLESPATAFIVTVDPTATTEEGEPGVSVTAVVACEDGSEYDVTSLVASLTLTYNSTTQPIPDSGIYTV